ncbi:MAG: thermonuclease family protein [Thermosediminibacteraceae bacterium]|nr:thermonuclease family protein [Thermosediminibacteraceae bacterium]
MRKRPKTESSQKLLEVIDGDTVEVESNDKRETVRMIGIDTPETVRPEKEIEYYRKEASDFTKSRLKAKMSNWN